jgi:tetratricopeptide (TPR) repeat protein
VDYWFIYNDEELLRRAVRTQQMQWNEEPSADTSEVVSGTLLVNANLLAPDPWFDYTSLRSSKPVERFGNLLVYRGRYSLPNQRAGRLTVRALLAIYSEKPDLAKAEQLLRQAVALAPQVYFANLELGNLLAQRGDREQAVKAYEGARAYAPVGEPIAALLSQQIELVSHRDPKSVPPVRDPWLE